MITLTAKLSLTGDSNGTLSNATSNLSKNNISSDLSAILGVEEQNANPFIIGASKVGDSSTFASENCGVFVGNQFAQGNTFTNSYSITLSGSNIDLFTIAFDIIHKRHPNTIIVDGATYECNNAICTITANKSSTHTIVINNWNADGYPLVISGIYLGEKINIDNSNLISLSTSIFDRSDYKLPSYGIISNVGNLEFNDNKGKVLYYAENLLLTSDLKVVVKLNNTITHKSEQVAVMETGTWTYDNDNKSVSVSLKDDLEEWQDIQIQGFDYDPRNPRAVLTNGTMEDLYRWLYNKTPSKYNMLSFDELDSNTKSVLTNTIITYPLLEDGTLWEQWTKLCEVCGLYIYKNNKGETVCSSTYGS